MTTSVLLYGCAIVYTSLVPVCLRLVSFSSSAAPYLGTVLPLGTSSVLLDTNQ